MKYTIHLRLFKFFQQGKESGKRHYLLPKDAGTYLDSGQEVLLEGLGSDGRSYGTGHQTLIRVQRISLNPNTGFYEIGVDHPWWNRAVCEKPDYPMGTGVKPIELSTHLTDQEHILAYGC